MEVPLRKIFYLILNFMTVDNLCLLSLTALGPLIILFVIQKYMLMICLFIWNLYIYIYFFICLFICCNKFILVFIYDSLFYMFHLTITLDCLTCHPGWIRQGQSVLLKLLSQFQEDKMLLICKYEPFSEESVQSLILRWPLKPVGLLFKSNIISRYTEYLIRVYIFKDLLIIRYM